MLSCWLDSEVIIHPKTYDSPMIWNSVDVKLWFADVKVIVVNVFHQSLECWMVGFPRFSHVLFFSRASHVWFCLGKVQGGVPVSLAKLICNFIVTMVRRIYGWYIYTVLYLYGLQTNKYHWGAPPCRFYPLYPTSTWKIKRYQEKQMHKVMFNDPQTAHQIERKAMFTALH